MHTAGAASSRMPSRAVRNWLQLVVQVGLFVGVPACVQVLAERTTHRFDLTPTAALSFSAPARQVLAQVSEAMTVTVFHRRGERARYVELLRRVQAQNAHITVALYDLDRYPERARALGVTRYGWAAIEYEGRRVVVAADPQEQLIGGVLRAIRGRARRVGFTTGHGERTPGGDNQSLGRFTAALANENEVAEPVSLLDGAVPPDTDLVVVAGPRHDFLPVELMALVEYLKAGGALLLLLDPGPLPEVTRFLSSLGVVLGDDFIVDRTRRVVGTDGLAAVVEQFRPGNPVTDGGATPLESGVVLPSARSVDVTGDEVPGVDGEAFARVGESAWAMADADRARRGEEPSAARHDRRGPVPVAVLLQVGRPGGERPGRAVVIGDVDFATDAYLDLLGNRDLALNAVAWLVGEDALAGERHAPVPEVLRPLSPLVLTEVQARGILIGSAIMPPVLVFVCGVVLVGRGRRRG